MRDVAKAGECRDGQMKVTARERDLGGSGCPPQRDGWRGGRFGAEDLRHLPCGSLEVAGPRRQLGGDVGPEWERLTDPAAALLQPGDRFPGVGPLPEGRLCGEPAERDDVP